MVEISEFSEHVEIYVSDFACGINKKAKDSIFSELKKSNKKFGFGFGLYFAKNLSVTKLKGDLILINDKNPTKFMLKIAKNLKG